MQLRAAKKRDFPSYGGQSPLDPRCPLAISHHRESELSNNLYSQSEESVVAVANVGALVSDARIPVSPTAQRLKTLYTPDQTPTPRRNKVDSGSGDFGADSIRGVPDQPGTCCPVPDIRRWIFNRHRVDPDQDAFALRDHGHRLDLGARSFRLLPVCARRSSGKTSSASWCWPFTPPIWSRCWPESAIRVSRCCSHWRLTHRIFVNATQFILKLRAARRDERIAPASAPSLSGSQA